MAELFLENIEHAPSTFYSMIAALTYLNPEFKNALLKLSSDPQYQKIIRLFSTASRQPPVSSDQIQEQRDLFDYFTTEPDSGFLYSPEIYLSLIPGVLEREAEEISRFFDFQFKPNSLYNCYLPSSVLFRLFEESFDAAEKMLLLIIVIIHCAKGDTDFDTWIAWLSKQGLYLNQYKELYAKLFHEYSSCTKSGREHFQKDIKEWLEENRQQIFE